MNKPCQLVTLQYKKRGSLQNTGEAFYHGILSDLDTRDSQDMFSAVSVTTLFCFLWTYHFNNCEKKKKKREIEDIYTRRIN